MATPPYRRNRPRLEALEARVVLSLPPSANTFGLTPPANTIGLGEGDVARPGGVGSSTVAISTLNITPGKSSTEFGVFVQPYGNSAIVPRIVGVEENGKRLPVQFGRSYTSKLAGQPTDQSVSFFETGKAGTVTILVAGKGLGAGAYTVETTLPGDVNGDGQVNPADEQAFAKTYVESIGDEDYKSSADYNQNGIVNLYDALAMERNMTPMTRRGGPWAAINLAPSDEIPYPGPKDSGGDTAKKDVTIDGYTTPGSIVLVDSNQGDYTFASQALATNAQGFFTVQATNTSGVNTYNFKILDPFGHQYIRSFPVFWTTYAEPGSPIQSKPSKNPYQNKKI
jgi:Dockerin type I domain